jgi:hypothetical protein
MIETVPPLEKSLTIRTSPLVCTPLKVPFAFSETFFWKNQKPCWASPLLSKRSEPKNSRLQLVTPVATGQCVASGVFS